MKILVLLLVVAAIAAPVINARHHGDHGKNGKHGRYGKHDDNGHKKHDDDDDDHYQEDYEALQKRLDLVTSRLHTIDDELDERFDEDLREKAIALEYRVSVLEEATCDDDHYDCGPTDHECVSRLFVCDGQKDCRNGADEELCTLPTKKGDYFEGLQVYENCSESLPETFDFTISAVKVHSAFPAFPRIKAVLHFAESTDDDDHEIAYPTDGYYRFATHKLVLRPPIGRGVGLVCDFDGHNEDRCVGDILSEGSLKACARYIFHRKEDDDDDDQDDDQDDDPKNGDHKKH